MIKNLIIGAGPAGLAVAGRMRQAGLDFRIFEKSNHVGDAWYKHYDRLHLHTVKQWSHLPGMEFPEDYPLYVPRKKLIEYFGKYVERFEINPEFGKEVLFVTKQENGTWKVQMKAGEIFEAEQVVFATGLNRVPNIPTWRGQENFKGSITHSSGYKNPKPFAGKKTMVIGMGNTGAEVAFDLSEYGVETYLSVRGKVSVVPRDLNGRSVQVTGKQLEKLPLGLGDWLGTLIRKIYFGDLSKYGLETLDMPPAKLLRDTGKTPVIDIGTIKAIKKGKIKVVGEVAGFSETGIQLKTGEEIEVDSVILATGFRPIIENFLERGTELLDKLDYPNPPVAAGYHEGIYFVGFDNYKLGGILGTIYTDSETVVKHIVKN